MTKKQEVTYPIDTTLQDVTEKRCPVLYALDLIGQKWKLPILWYLHEKENTRYNELKRRIPGITNMMLTKSLRELEADGLVKRTEYQTIPPKVEYSLTNDGQNLLPTLNELYKWGESQMSLTRSTKK
jgi:DNA-binding HxlR family transcriptional regulator